MQYSSSHRQLNFINVEFLLYIVIVQLGGVEWLGGVVVSMSDS